MHFGKDNGVPMMMAGADTVLEEIELAVERLLICPSASTAELSPEVSAMAEIVEEPRSDDALRTRPAAQASLGALRDADGGLGPASPVDTLLNFGLWR